MITFKVIEEYENKNIEIPKRIGDYSPGYDIKSAEDIIVPSIYTKLRKVEGRAPIPGLFDSRIKRITGLFDYENEESDVYTLDEIKDEINKLEIITMVPTGLCVALNPTMYLSLHIKSDIGINSLLMIPNQTELITADSFFHEKHILIPLINLSPYDIKIKKGDSIAIGIIHEYELVDGDKYSYISEDSKGFVRSVEYYQNILPATNYEDKKKMSRDRANAIIDTYMSMISKGYKPGPKTQKVVNEAIEVLLEPERK